MSNFKIIDCTDVRTIVSQVIEEKINTIPKWLEAKLVQNKRPITAKEAMEYLSMPKSTFYRYVNAGKIPKYGLGDRTYYKLSDLENAMIRIN